MTSATPNQQTKTDYELLLRRIRDSIIRGEDTDRIAGILRKKDLLDHLTAEQCLEWSRLCQMAGEIESAIQSLSFLNQRYPDSDQAWLEHWDLLNLLDHKEQAIALRARALEARPSLGASLVLPASQSSISEIGASFDEPFSRSKREEELLNTYMNIFQGREDCFARQWADRNSKTAGYVPVRRPINEADIRDHLRGLKTYGIYLLRQDSTSLLGVLDADLNVHDRERLKDVSQVRRERDYLIERISDLSKKCGLEPLVEFSGGKGYHFWYPFEEPADPAIVRAAIGRMAETLRKDLSFFQLEVFPKQDRLGGKGLGNLVKLPLGIHRASGKASYFLPRREGDVWSQLEALRGVRLCSLKPLEERPQAKVVMHPRTSQWLEPYPELKILTERCPALGHIFSACRNAKSLGVREEKIIFATIGFLNRGKTLIHALFQNLPEYNPHLVDYRLSMQRGMPLGCRKIHSLLGLSLDFCDFPGPHAYPHPLLHFPDWKPVSAPKAEKVENLSSALDLLAQSIEVVRRFLPNGQENPAPRQEQGEPEAMIQNHRQ